ncbi:hypothetical protein DYB32_008337 [Aphanomyces invadans]|uniref:Copine C-terminal domain-containing protein n=1 Tax=Aphanomyces invadans TaxID=157072 RepID=A0A3R7D079_9STRA|nr:hypothetical protein DYB32_008337 [Aphanomyces invadans]
MGRTLETFDDDKLIPVFGFGDASTGGSRCFPFLPDNHACHTFAQVLARYNQITPGINLAGPTNFAPIIREAIRICRQLRTYHILDIMEHFDDFLPARRFDNFQFVEYHKMLKCNPRNPDVGFATAALMEVPAIIMVGVGDGPWDMMQRFDDQLPTRRFDNFQFVEYDRMLRFNRANPEVGFATAALMEIPEQYKIIRKLGLL